MLDPRSEEKLSKVHPLLAERVRKVIASLLPVEYRVVQGLRTYAEQDALFRKRPKVTNARGGQSNHNFGLAVDLCPFVDGEFAWNADKLFVEIGSAVHAVGGLEWGGDWKFVDKPHVQLPGLTVSLCRAVYEKGGLATVWKRIGEINNEITIQTPVRDLQMGAKGEAVRKLQTALIARGFMLPRELDGDFGRSTRKAVIDFQRHEELDADGIVGEQTKKALGL